MTLPVSLKKLASFILLSISLVLPSLALAVLPIVQGSTTSTLLPGRVQSEWATLLRFPRLSYDRLNFSAFMVMPPSPPKKQASLAAGEESDSEQITDKTEPLQQTNNIRVTRFIIKGQISAGLKTQLSTYGQKLVSQTKPLDINAFERYILLMNDLPGVSVHPYFKRLSETSPCYVLVLDAMQRKGSSLPDLLDTTRLFLEENQSTRLVTPPAGRNYFLRLSYDNRNSRLLGGQRYTLDFNANALLGASTRTGYRMAVDNRTKQVTALEVRHSFALSNSGDRVYASFRQNHVRYDLRQFFVDDPFVPTIKARADEWRLVYVYPWLRRAQQNLYFDIGVKILNSHVNTYAHVPNSIAERFYQDKSRSLQLGLRYHNIDPFLGINEFAFHMWQGINSLEASKGAHRLSRLGANMDYTKLTMTISRFQSLGTHFGLLLSGKGQYGFTRLLASELLGFGGFDYGRGYEPSSLVGDSGFKGKAEFQLNSAYGWRFLEQVQWFAYYDWTTLWLRDFTPEGSTQRLSASSTGIGARLQFNPYFRGDIELAEPLHPGGGGSIYFNLTALL